MEEHDKKINELIGKAFQKARVKRGSPITREQWNDIFEAVNRESKGTTPSKEEESADINKTNSKEN